jgi:hypothetical protein
VVTRRRYWAVLAVVIAITIVLVGVLFRLRRRLANPETVVATTQRSVVPLQVAMVVLDGGLGPGWTDRGWGPHELSDGGPARVQFRGYGGIVLHHEELPSRFGALSFRFKAPTNFQEFLEVFLQHLGSSDQDLPKVQVEQRHLAEVGGGWQEAVIPWSELDPSGVPFDRIVLQAHRSVDEQWVQLDKIVLTTPSATATPAGPAPIRGVQLAIQCDQSAQPINPLVYGISQGKWETGETAHRVGGNPMTRLNWDLGAWNTGNDWYFENVKGATGIWDWIDETYQRHVAMAVVVPMIGWVAKDSTSFSFPVAKYGRQQANDPERGEAGNGKTPDGKPISPGPPTTTSIAAPPELIGQWIATLRRKDEERGGRGVQMYILDNEPNLWNTTHRDVHPDPITYDELLDRTVRYGTAIRQADPEAVIAGPAEWGWSGYFFSAKDTSVGWMLAPDRNLHGGTPLLPWYLQRLAQHEQRTKTRILDVVDVHFYPQAQGVYGNDARTDPDTAALRIRSTRALWDPQYKDESWINERINLIPRVKDWIVKNYPGRGISIGEWSFGAENHISGALAIAEALGRFGQQGITAAFYWATVSPNTPAFNAFRAFRNFDGKGSRFLDLSVPTREGKGVSLFASRDESGSKLVAIVLNLDATYAAQAEIDTSSCGVVRSRRVFSYGPSSSGLKEEPSASEVTPVSELVAPYSLKVIELNIGK